MNFSLIHHLRAGLRQAFAAALLGLSTNGALALDIQPYSADRLAQLQSGGRPVAVHFHAEWCGTCKTQEKALLDIKSEGSLPQVTLLVANYDKEKDLRRKMKVAAQSTLVVFRGPSEVARVGGETATDKLRSALSAAAKAS
jgi:thiol:disulfide interchange protein